MAACTHLDQVRVRGRPEAVASSPNRHATRHAREEDHPVLMSVEPEEDWSWCVVEEIGFVLADR